jgi:hypothetical protein
VAALEAALAYFVAERPPIHRRLIWFDEPGFGYYPCDPADAPYDIRYFEKYARYADTPLGAALNLARKRLIAGYWFGPVVDIGIGSGAFCEAREHTFGYDINPIAIEWLRDRERYWNPWVDPCKAVSMWDSLEHIPRFHELLANVTCYAFISLPVFKNLEDAAASKHFRPDEHYWYFTVEGLKRVMRELGFRCLETNANETKLGRQAIHSFVFERID